MKNLKITGFVEYYLTDWKTGIEKKICEGKNTIQTAFYTKLAEKLNANYDFALDDLFTTCQTSGVDANDGINADLSGYSESTHMSFKTTLAKIGTDVLRVTGLYDKGDAIEIRSVKLGKYWIDQPVGSNQGSFAELFIAWHIENISVPISTNLTVVWNITFTVH